jgi:hypothetical protein
MQKTEETDCLNDDNFLDFTSHFEPGIPTHIAENGFSCFSTSQVHLNSDIHTFLNSAVHYTPVSKQQLSSSI